MFSKLGQPVVDATPADDDMRCWSVTTIIGCLDKPALIWWAAQETAKAAIYKQDSWRAIREENGDDEAIDYLAKARFRPPKGERGAAELGTAVHEACEQYALTGVRPEVDDEIRPYLDQFDGWLDRFQPEYQATEVTVFSPTYGYAGTCDGFMTIGGVPLIIDYKTSKRSFDKKGNATGPYPEAALQLAAYRYAEVAAVWPARRFESYRRRYYLISQAEHNMGVPVPVVQGGIVIHITPDHCEAYPVRCDESVHRAFLFVQEVARWHFLDSRGAIGDPMTSPLGEDHAADDVDDV
jgi:hypothetical protein